MQVLQGLDGLRRLPAGTVMSIGNFDGMHRGHRHIVETARQLQRTAGGGAIALVTFEPHPLTVLKPEIAPPRLTPVALKEELMAAAGVEYLVILPPEPAVLNMSAEDFWAILRDETRPAHLVEGSSFNFGKDRRGTIDRLREWSAGTGVQLHVVNGVTVPLLDLQVVPVSSSLIRWLIAHGRVRDAAICLGRPYVLEGAIVRGHGRGRTIGIPTANLRIADQLIPADGVYAGRCTIDGTAYPAATSIGTMPTFGGQNQRQVEAHLVGYDGDLYDQNLRLEMIDWLRDQHRFAGPDALKAQLARDIEQTIQRHTLDPSRPIARSA